MIYFLTFVLLVVSTFITISSSSPLIAWLGLELNTFSFIPLSKNKNNICSHESMIKYFLIQSITSVLFLTSTLLFHYCTYNLLSFFFFNVIFVTMTSLALLIKLALAPFHFWLFPLVKSVSWLSFILLMTWQKVAPLFLMSYFFSKLVVFSVFSSIIIPPMMMISQNSIKMILGYASIIHMAWLLMINFLSISLVYMYMCMYMVNFFPIYCLLSFWDINYITQINFIPNSYKFFLFVLILSLSGFPPLMMFMIKITLVLQFILSGYYMLSMLLLVSSLIIAYVYIFMSFPFLFNNLWLSFKFLLFPRWGGVFLVMIPMLSVLMLFVFFI